MLASVTIEYFCEDLVSMGDPMEQHFDNRQVMIARKYRGGHYVGVSLNTVTDIDYTKYADIDYTKYHPKYHEVGLGSKIAIAGRGCEIILPIEGAVGDFIRPRKDGTWKVGCKPKRAVGQIMSCSGTQSKVKLC
jgi:hypothetical protein